LRTAFDLVGQQHLEEAGIDKRTSDEMNRRRFLKLMAGGAVLAGGAPLWLPFSPDKGFPDSRVEAAGSRYRVGVGKVWLPPDNTYWATRRAVAACGEWPAGAIAGRTVMIKPNLVVGMPAQSGVTTDPEVVRALVDLALESWAEEVVIVEGGPDGAQFSLCGYDLFDGYHQRVRLAALEDLPIDIYRVDNGMAYAHLYPRVFWPKLPQSTDITYWVDRDCRARVDIVRTSDISPWRMQHIHTLRDWTDIPAGEHVVAWDGKNDKGHIVPAGMYGVRVRADSYSPQVFADSYAMNWVAVARA